MTITSHEYTVRYGFIKECFIDTADENYIAFRVCFLNRIDNEISWQAAHAIEKYIKAILIMKDIPVKSLSHSLLKLCDELFAITNDFLCDTQKENIIIFLKKLGKLGSPDSRYGIKGHDINGEFVKQVDELVFILRRLYRQLTQIDTKIRLMENIEAKRYAPGDEEQAKGLINKIDQINRINFLSRDLDEYFKIEDSFLNNLIDNDRNSGIKDCVFQYNNCFAPKDYEHNSPVFQRGASKQKPLDYALGHLPTDEKKKDFINWVKDHMKISNNDIPQI